MTTKIFFKMLDSSRYRSYFRTACRSAPKAEQFTRQMKYLPLNKEFTKRLMKRKYVYLIVFFASLLYVPVKFIKTATMKDKQKTLSVRGNVAESAAARPYSVDGSIVDHAIRQLQPLTLFRSSERPYASAEAKPGLFAALLARNPYTTIIRKISRKYQVDHRLVTAVMKTESDFNPRAKSPAGAIGLMQLMPKTAAMYDVRQKELFNPQRNVEAGVRHLSHLLKRYPDRQDLVIAAYNAGEGSVDKYRGVPPFQETQNYVTRVQLYYNAM